jgi:prefoldin subunit 5
MHSEQVEAIVEKTIEHYFGKVETLEGLQAILQKTNLKMVPEGESSQMAQDAKLIQSLFVSHTNLARVVGNLAEALQRLQERIVILESTIPPMQEAVINLQVRLKSVETTA